MATSYYRITDKETGRVTITDELEDTLRRMFHALDNGEVSSAVYALAYQAARHSDYSEYEAFLAITVERVTHG